MMDERRGGAAWGGGARAYIQGLAMEPEIPPQYHLIKVVMTDGTEFFTRSTYGKAGDTLHLDIDPTTHPAWTGGSQHLVDRGGRLSRFKSPFRGPRFCGKKVAPGARDTVGASGLLPHGDP